MSFNTIFTTKNTQGGKLQIDNYELQMKMGLLTTNNRQLTTTPSSTLPPESLVVRGIWQLCVWQYYSRAGLKPALARGDGCTPISL
jgi:hypothetical protein